MCKCALKCESNDLPCWILSLISMNFVTELLRSYYPVMLTPKIYNKRLTCQRKGKEKSDKVEKSLPES